MILHTSLKFQDFISESNYAALQYKFASYDEKYNGLLESKFDNFIENDFVITYKLNDEIFSELSFYNDFLFPKIDELAKSTINKIQQKLNADFQYDKLKTELFIKDKLDECYNTDTIIKNNTFLNEEIREQLSTQMDIVLEFLNNDYLKNFEFKDKFSFKLIEQDLLLLITLLRDKRRLVIENESLLGHLIERHFECYDEATLSYKKIQRAGKKINNIKNDFKTVKKSIARLKDLLQDDSFYEL